jgi:hypothetical protein
LRSKLLRDDGDNKARSPGSNCILLYFEVDL